MTIEIRILGLGDHGLLTSAAPGVFDAPVDPRLSEEFLSDGRHHLAAAVEGGRVVGMASAVHYVHPDKGPELWINEVGVAPSHRGRGIGGRLVVALLERGRALGCTEAWVLTDRSNEAARRLYAGAGGKEATGETVLFSFSLREGSPPDERGSRAAAPQASPTRRLPGIRPGERAHSAPDRLRLPVRPGAGDDRGGEAGIKEVCRAAQGEDRLALEAVRADVLGVAPGLRGAAIARLGEGMYCRTFLVGGDLVFRFPKDRMAGGLLEREILLLPELAPRLRLRVPVFELIGRMGEGGLPFVAYRLISGEPLTAARFAGLPAAGQERVLAGLGGFLSDLHAIPAEVSRAGSLGADELGTTARDEIRRCRELIYPMIDRETCERLEQTFTTYLEAADGTDPVLIHTDLNPEHILISADEGRLSGIIDFGSAATGDPDYDFWCPYRDHGARFVEGLLRHYPRPRPDRLAGKIPFFRAWDALGQALMGIDGGDPALLSEGIAGLRVSASMHPPVP